MLNVPPVLWNRPPPPVLATFSTMVQLSSVAVSGEKAAAVRAAGVAADRAVGQRRGWALMPPPALPAMLLLTVRVDQCQRRGGEQTAAAIGSEAELPLTVQPVSVAVATRMPPPLAPRIRCR